MNTRKRMEWDFMIPLLLCFAALVGLSACPALGAGNETAYDAEADSKAIPAGYAAEPATADTGSILQAYMWKFSAITSNMAAIANAGYTAVQTSPVQPTKEATSTWWLLYQPCDFIIGNSQLGTASEFSTMCSTAKSYGIKIIVDAVLNHVADNGTDGVWATAVASYLKNSAYYHNFGTCTNYASRWNVTQQNLGNLPDLNTQNSTVQGFLINFLNTCYSAGADGFRFDAAKHIETNIGEDSGQSWAGTFWSNVASAMSGKSVYNYLEVIPDTADNHQAYTTYGDITAHNYIYTLYNAVVNRNVTGLLSYSSGFDSTVDPKKCLVYAENHDSYQDGKTSGYTYDQRKLMNALALARADITIMLFDRPTDDLWKDADIVAMNVWRNKCYGLSEYLRYPNNSCLAVERGSKGIAFINTGSSACSVNIASTLPAGSYVSSTSSAVTMTVSGGYVTGSIPAGAIVAIYANGTATPTPAPTPTPGTVPAAPVISSVNNATASSLTVTWAAVSGANAYTVWRSTSSTGTYAAIENTVNTVYSDTGLAASSTYWYKVSATNDAGTSALSAAKSGTTLADTGTTTTTIKIVYDVGLGNTMYVRGSVSPLSWTTGTAMTWTTGNAWTWSTTAIPDGTKFEFKGLINNTTWSDGANFEGIGGTTITVYPTFNGNFYDTMDTLDNWTVSGYTGTGKWHISSSRARAYGCTTESVMTYKYTMVKTGTKVTLAFKYQVTGLDSGEYLAVDVSKDGGATWAQVKTITGTVSTATNTAIDVTAYKSTNFKLRFRTKMSSTTEYAYVDNVSVSVVK